MDFNQLFFIRAFVALIHLHIPDHLLKDRSGQDKLEMGVKCHGFGEIGLKAHSLAREGRVTALLINKYGGSGPVKGDQLAIIPKRQAESPDETEHNEQFVSAENPVIFGEIYRLFVF